MNILYLNTILHQDICSNEYLSSMFDSDVIDLPSMFDSDVIDKAKKFKSDTSRLKILEQSYS